MTENSTVNSTAKTAGIGKFTCSICGKNFDDVHQFAKHMTEHSEEAKRREAEDEKKRINDQRKRDIEELERLYADKSMAEKKLDKALDAYREKYGGLIFTRPIDDSLYKFLRTWF